LLSVSSLGDVGYVTLFKVGHVFVYGEGVNLVKPQLINDWVDRLYIMRGQTTVVDESNEEKEDLDMAVGTWIQYQYPMKERESLLNIGKRLKCYEWKKVEGVVDYPRS
jgi:hypothetical protein